MTVIKLGIFLMHWNEKQSIFLAQFIWSCYLRGQVSEVPLPLISACISEQPRPQGASICNWSEKSLLLLLCLKTLETVLFSVFVCSLLLEFAFFLHDHYMSLFENHK